MNYAVILKEGEGVLLWLYKNITNKFTNIFKKLKDQFPILNRYPLLKYSLIPMLLAVFLLLRYIINYFINEFAAWVSDFVGETSGFIISERVIVLSIVATVIILRIGLGLRNQKKKKNNELKPAYEKTK